MTSPQRTQAERLVAVAVDTGRLEAADAVWLGERLEDSGVREAVLEVVEAALAP